jgi:hypothetical protein
MNRRAVRDERDVAIDARRVVRFVDKEGAFGSGCGVLGVAGRFYRRAAQKFRWQQGFYGGSEPAEVSAAKPSQQRNRIFGQYRGLVYDFGYLAQFSPVTVAWGIFGFGD